MSNPNDSGNGESNIAAGSRAKSAALESARSDMVERQLRSRDIRSLPVLEAMGSVPRHLFVPPEYAREAYADSPLPIGAGQTISQPYMVAAMADALLLEGSEKVLEIGAGSGYQAAVLSLLAREVIAIEILCACQAMDFLSKGHMLADVVAIIGSMDIVFGEIDR